jgi:HAD superfamily hydrolase (TIGR01509 family)
MEYDLIVFDCDGTLVDTEHALNTAFIQKLHELAPQAYKQFDVPYILENCMGKTVPGIFDRMEEDTGISIVPILRAKIIAAYQSILPESLKLHLKRDPLLINILESLSAHFKICVASNGLAKTVGMSLAAAGLSAIFKENVFAAEHVAHPKPAPDLIRYAAQKMDATNMSRILHIEDAPRGAMAGIAAGVNVIGYTGHADNKNDAADKLREVGVIHVFDTWEDIAAFVIK